MPRLRTYKTEAVVLKQMPLGEAARILTFYTPDMGKLRAVARGVRRPKSRLGGHLELLNRVSVSLAHGRNLDVVTEAQVLQGFRGVRDDLQTLSRALYLAELIDTFSSEQSANRPLYRLLVDALGWLEKAAQPDQLLRHFEIRLLEHSGYRPELYFCGECKIELEPGGHLFDRSIGSVLCPACRVTSPNAMIPISLNGMKALRFLQNQEQYADATGLNMSADLLAEIERLLGNYVRFLAERELRTAEFMYRVR